MAFSSLLVGQEQPVSSLQHMSLSKVITQLHYDESLKKQLVSKILQEQIGYDVERPIVKSIIAAAHKEVELARHFKDYMKVITFENDAKVQLVQDINWQYCNNVIFSASDSGPLYSINILTGVRQSLIFLNTGLQSVFSNCLATNKSQLVAHAEGAKSPQGTYYTIFVWAADSQKVVHTCELPLDIVPQSLAISDSNDFLAIGFANNSGRFIKLVDINNHKELITVAGTSGSFEGDYFEYYTTPNAADLVLNLIDLKKDNAINNYEHADYDCDKFCNRPNCLKRKVPHLFKENILLHHPTEDSVLSYDDNKAMVFPKLVVDQKNNSVALICGNSVKIYTLDQSELLKNFTQFDEKTEEVDLIVPKGDVIVTRNKNNSERRMYSISNEQPLQEFKAHSNTPLHFNSSNNTIGFYENTKWTIVPTHRFVMDHAQPQEMLRAFWQEE